MATLRDIKRRITSVRNTMQITSAMKMVSAAKLNRAQNAARAAQPYSAHLRQMVGLGHPQALIRIGYGAEVAPTPRRSLEEMLVDS